MTKVINTSGKRKRALAKASLMEGSGLVRINHQSLETYGSAFARARISEAIKLAEETAKKVDINVKVIGGGWQGQAEAARLAIARALVKFDKKLKERFLKYDRHLLIADVRRREAYKPNDSKARAARQFSKR